MEKGGLAATVAADAAPGLPVGVDLKAYIFKDVVIAALIGKVRFVTLISDMVIFLLHKKIWAARKSILAAL